jgi:hypothetical protein
MKIDTELGILIPTGNFIISQRFAGRLKIVSLNML